VIVSSTGDNREKDPPRGIFGGEDGRAGQIIRNPGTPEAIELPSKMTDVRLDAGDCLEVTLVSAAGYGDPLKRDPEKVHRDVLDDLVSIDDARVKYRVAIDEETKELDQQLTLQLRAQRES